MTDYLTTEEAEAQNAREAEFCITLLAKDRIARTYGSHLIQTWTTEKWDAMVQQVIEGFDDDDIASAISRYAYKR